MDSVAISRASSMSQHHSIAYRSPRASNGKARHDATTPGSMLSSARTLMSTGCGKNKGATRAPLRYAVDSRLVLGRYDHLDRSVYIGVQGHRDLELAGVTQRAFAHHDFTLFQRMSGSAERLGDIARTDRAEQLAFRTRLALDRDRGAFERGQARLRGTVKLTRLGLVLGATLFELGQIGLRRRNRLALRHEEVAAVARLDVDLVAKVAEVFYFLQQYQLHVVLRFVSAGRLLRRSRLLSESRTSLINKPSRAQHATITPPLPHRWRWGRGYGVRGRFSR